MIKNENKNEITWTKLSFLAHNGLGRNCERH